MSGGPGGASPSARPLRRRPPEEAVGGLAPARPAPDGRPRVIVSMVVSADGRAALQGRSRPLSGPVDLAVLLALRTRVDALLVGPGTLRAERYGRPVRDPARRAGREAAGLAPAPLLAVVSRSGELPLDIPLFHDPASEVVVFTAEGAGEAAAGLPARITWHRLPPAELAPAPVLRRLRREHGVGCLLGEGGPRLNAALLQAGLVDELFLTLAPTLVGGPAPGIVAPAPAPGGPVDLELVHLLEADGALYLRYAVRRAAG